MKFHPLALCSLLLAAAGGVGFATMVALKMFSVPLVVGSGSLLLSGFICLLWAERLRDRQQFDEEKEILRILALGTDEHLRDVLFASSALGDVTALPMWRYLQTLRSQMPGITLESYSRRTFVRFALHVLRVPWLASADIPGSEFRPLLFMVEAGHPRIVGALAPFVEYTGKDHIARFDAFAGRHVQELILWYQSVMNRELKRPFHRARLVGESPSNDLPDVTLLSAAMPLDSLIRMLQQPKEVHIVARTDGSFTATCKACAAAVRTGEHHGMMWYVCPGCKRASFQAVANVARRQARRTVRRDVRERNLLFS